MAGVRWIALALIAAVVLAPAPRLLAQSGSAPLKATIFFQNPPPGAIPVFSTTIPISIVVQVQNTSGAPLVTTEGFSRTDFFRQLYFVFNNTSTGGSTEVNTSGAALHQHVRVGQCLSRRGVLQTPAIPVAPVETLSGPTSPFFVEYTIPDGRLFYDLSRGGRYTVKALIPFSSFSVDPATLITDCDNFPTPVLNIGGPGSTRQDFTIVSNSLDFKTCCNTFVGFGSPLGPESSCSTSPCLTTNFGNTVPVKFGLLDATTGTNVKDAVAVISVTQLSGTPPPQPPTDLGGGSSPTNTFRFGSSGNQYIFNLDTSVLARGVWQLTVSINDGSTHTAQFRIR